MSHRDLIVRVQKGQILPENFIQRAKAGFPDVLGCAAVRNGALLVKQFTKDKCPDAAGVLKICNSFKDDDLFLFFGGCGAGYSAESMQPFCLLEDQAQKDLLVGFLAGDFSNVAEPSSPHSQAYFAVEKLLRPKLDYLMHKSGGTLAKLREEFSTTVFQHDMKTLGAGNTSVILLPVEGNPAIWSTSDKAKFIDDGQGHGFWTSDHLGFVKGAAEEVHTEPAEPKEEDPFGDAVSSPNGEPSAQPDKQPDQKPAGATGTMILVSCPSDVIKMGNKDILLFYKLWDPSGKAPSNWKNKPQVQVNKAMWTWWNAQRKEKKVVFQNRDQIDAAMKAMNAGTDTAVPTNAGAGSTPTNTAETAQGEAMIWPNLTAARKQKFDDLLKTELFKKLALSDSFDPSKAMEKRGHEGIDVAVQMGIKGGLEGTANWSYAAFRELGNKVDVDTLAMLTSNWVNYALELQKMILETGPSDTAAEEEIKATGTDGAPPKTSVPATATAAPTRANKYAGVDISKV